MMNKMIVANLVHRPIRSLISIIAIALEVTLILLIVGLCYGMLIGAKDKASIFYVKLDDPKNADDVVKSVKSIPGMEKYSVLSTADYISMMTPSHLPGFNAFIGVVIGVSVVIGFIVIFQAMYTAVMERTREIGILKSMGASKFYVVNVILRETILLAIGGIALGMLCSTAGRLAIRHKLPLLTVVITSDWLIR